MSQRPDENATGRGNNVDNSTVPSSPENPAGEATATIAILDSDDELPPVSDFIDLCVSPSTSAAAAGNSSSSILKNATEQSQQTDAAIGAAATATHAAPVLECPICLQTCIHPARLPCGHIFCFLCVKGVAYKNRRCAMCRREIPPEFLDHPQLVNGIDDICTTKATEDGYQWYYEGRNGWWQYDDRTSQDIEESYKKGEKSCTILVAGYVYIVDLEAMLQQRQNEPTRCRRVKRDLATIPKKGVAGLRIEGNTVTTDTNFATQLQQQQQQHQSATDVRLRLNSSDFISTMAATDAAIRIASDIIGSTLAHADELTRGLSANSVGGGINDESSSSGEHALTRSLSNIHNAVVEEPAAALRSTAVTSNSNANLHTIQDLMRSATEDLLGTTQQVIETNQHSLDLFEQALNDFQALTLRNMSDSSDDDDNELVVAENDEPAQQDTNADANRSLRF